MSLYDDAIVPMTKTLRNVPAWLDKAEAHATALGFQPDVLLEARLYPDQFALVRQIQSACDTLKLAVARLTSKSAPVHKDTESNLGEIRTRIHETLQFVDGFDPKDFEGAEEKLIPVPFAPNKVARGDDLIREFSLPNFYFHVTHTYALLRTNGVPLGKRDYIGRFTMTDAEGNSP